MSRPARSALRVDRSGSLVRVTAEAPAGMVWSDGGVHELVSEARGGREATAAAVEDVRARMALGLGRCDDAACDWCRPADE